MLSVEKIQKHSEMLHKVVLHADTDLSKAIKQYYSTIQREVDKITELIFDYIHGDVKVIKEHRREKYNQELILIITPGIQIRANDIAPKYNLKAPLKWHIYGHVKNFLSNYESWISGECVVAQASECVESLNLKNKIEEFNRHGISVSLLEPPKKNRKLVMSYIEKHNMIERFELYSEGHEVLK
jgi:hypothetical protein